MFSGSSNCLIWWCRVKLLVKNKVKNRKKKSSHWMLNGETLCQLKWVDYTRIDPQNPQSNSVLIVYGLKVIDQNVKGAIVAPPCGWQVKSLFLKSRTSIQTYLPSLVCVGLTVSEFKALSGGKKRIIIILTNTTLRRSKQIQHFNISLPRNQTHLDRCTSSTRLLVWFLNVILQRKGNQFFFFMSQQIWGKAS